jgi:hypothetical protein
VKSAHALEEYYRKWRPVADAQLRHLDALVKDDEAFERLRYMWRNGHGDPRIVVTELSAIAVRHGVAVLTDAEIEAMAQSADAGEGAN